MALDEGDFFDNRNETRTDGCVDDAVACRTYGKRFDIPSQHSLVFLQQGASVVSPDGG